MFVLMNLLLLLWTNFTSSPIFNFEQVFADWVAMQTLTHLTFKFSKSTIKTLKQGVKVDQN